MITGDPVGRTCYLPHPSALKGLLGSYGVRPSAGLPGQRVTPVRSPRG
ncbi:CRISPR-associated protein Cas5 [Microbispora cellulosiformans]|uniref:CRISPR-associated protein Cas5 n=1 Tax=Microbispora cellulosiformans TaxID=2614688 RepID=A0A5J5K4Y6_9ACTN|nr:CRISPR-associated protein Cas5 [Microbispora cellulosiformans]